MTKKHLVKRHEKKSKNPKFSDPSAFYMKFPRIEQAGNGTALSKMPGMNETSYRMGPVRATVSRPSESGFSGYFMTIRGRDRYPTWDEMVWLKYNLLPDACRMAFILPNLNAYINFENSDQNHGSEKFVFTLEQTGWLIDPMPKHCNQDMVIDKADGRLGHLKCAICNETMTIDLTSWNEMNGNGFNVVKWQPPPGTENSDEA